MGRKYSWSPEARKRHAERMKALHANKKGSNIVTVLDEISTNALALKNSILKLEKV